MSRGRRALIIVGAAITAAVLTILLLQSPSPHTAHEARGTVASPAASEPQSHPAIRTPPALPASPQDFGSKGRLVVPSIGLMVNLKSMAARNHVVNPPTSDAAYMISGYGTPANPTSTIFVAIHSSKKGTVAGDRLTNTGSGRSTLRTGDAILADGKSFTVTRTETLSKSAVAAGSDVFANVPGRLVLITCLQSLDGHPSVNEIVFATAEGQTSGL